MGDPDGVASDVGACEVVVRGDGVAAAEGDLAGGAEAKLGSDDEVSGFKPVGAGGVMVVGFEFGAVEGAVFDGPFTDACLPAVDGAFAGGWGGFVEGGGDDEGGRIGEERVEGECEGDEGEEEVHGIADFGGLWRAGDRGVESSFMSGGRGHHCFCWK